MKNRHQRRSEKKTRPPCSSCGDKKKPYKGSPIDGKVRCMTCHDMHLKHMSGAKDEQTTMQKVRWQQFQEALNKAVQETFPDPKAEDVAVIVNGFGVAAAIFSIGVEASEAQFVDVMRGQYRKTAELLGVEIEEKTKPLIVLPS